MRLLQLITYYLLLITSLRIAADTVTQRSKAVGSKITNQRQVKGGWIESGWTQGGEITGNWITV